MQIARTLLTAKDQSLFLLLTLGYIARYNKIALGSKSMDTLSGRRESGEARANARAIELDGKIGEGCKLI